MPVWSRLSTPIFQNTGSTARDHLASERTFLAWIRTGLGFIALGIAVERFSQLDLDSLVQQLRPSPSPTSSPAGATSGAAASPPRPPPRADRRWQASHEPALVGGLLGTGSGSVIYGTARYFTNLKLLQAGLFKPAYHGVAVLSVGCAAMAGAAYWGTLRRDAASHHRGVQ